VIARPGAESRLREVDGVEAAVVSLGYSPKRIEPPGTLDGGDVLQVGGTLYVGTGGRTNSEGVRQLRTILEPLGATLVAVPVRKVLHLKSAVTALPDGAIVGYPPLVEEPELFPRFMPVPEESGAHVVDLGGSRVLLASDCPRTTELFFGLGYEPAVVDIGEFQKLEGCVTCLSVLLRD
jgi:dimethylargininase